ncbi:MAG: hypothetical protein PHO46_07240 [Thermoguttaceae bacterium]|jgi:hypothetical protein|nr:hypothetical protein [Thermoguttaceae bacterium]
MTRKNIVAALVALAVVLSASTGCKPKEAVVPVSGVATYQGEPLAYCSIYFTPTNPASPDLCITSVGKTDAEGRFELTTTELEARKGAVVGQHKVAFKFMQWGTEFDEDEGPGADEVPLLPAEYTQGTKITFEVPEKGTDSANFDLD